MSQNKHKKWDWLDANVKWPSVEKLAGFTGIPATPEVQYTRPAATVRPKLGRNEPCWCGTGKKYKACHLNRDLKGR
jgi:hypothetical protein